MPPQRDDVNLARIRDNQRRSRARRKEYQQELEQRVRAFEQLGVEASAEVQQAARRVADENRRLRALLQQEHGVSAAAIEAYLWAGRAAAAAAEPAATTAAMAAAATAVAPSVEALDQVMGPRFLPARETIRVLSGEPGSPGWGGGGGGGGGGSSDDASGVAYSALSADESGGGVGRRQSSSSRGHSHGRGHGHGHGHGQRHQSSHRSNSDRGRQTKRDTDSGASESPSFSGAAALQHVPLPHRRTATPAAQHSSPSLVYASSSAPAFATEPYITAATTSFYENLDATGGEGFGQQRHQQQPQPQPFASVDPMFFDYGLAPPYGEGIGSSGGNNRGSTATRSDRHGRSRDVTGRDGGSVGLSTAYYEQMDLMGSGGGGDDPSTCAMCMAGLVCSLHGTYYGG